MRVRWVGVATVALLLAALAGFLFSELVWSPSRFRLESELAASEQAAGALANSAQEILTIFDVQLLSVPFDPEPASAVGDGIFLARITSASDSGAFVADWHGGGPLGLRPSSNTSPFTQTIRMSSRSAVVRRSADGISIIGSTERDAVERRDFFNSLADSVEPGAPNDATWAVTMVDGECVLLVEVPGQASS